MTEQARDPDPCPPDKLHYHLQPCDRHPKRLYPQPGDELPLIVVTPAYRTAENWLTDRGINPRDLRAVRIILGHDRLRGMGGGRHIVVINPGGFLWNIRTWQQVSDYLTLIRHKHPETKYEEVWV